MRIRLFQRILLVLASFFILFYVGYQIYRYLHSGYKTEVAYTYTVEQTTRVTGIVLRKELLLEEEIKDGVASYTVNDGTKVSYSSLIAEVYGSQEDVDNVKILRELENQAALLKQAQDPGTTSFVQTDVLNKQISSALNTVISSVDHQAFYNLKENADSLLTLMNTKQIATGKQADFSEALEKINAEAEYYRNQIADRVQNATKIIAPRPGYFIRNIDGYENCLDLNNLDQLTPEQIQDLKPKSTKEYQNRVGKLMIDHNWYYAVVIPTKDLELYQEGASVTVDFNISGLDPVPMTIQTVNHEKDSEQAVVVFHCNYINEYLVNLRVTSADVDVRSFTGLRVSNSALRFDGIQEGVYIIIGDKLLFRPVTVFYEGVGFSLCREYDPKYETSTGAYRGLQQYDQVVIEGTQMYNEKRIK